MPREKKLQSTLQQVKNVRMNAAAELGLNTPAAAYKPEDWKAATESAVLQQSLASDASVLMQLQVAQVEASSIQCISSFHACWHEQEQQQQWLEARQGQTRRRSCRAVHRSRQEELVQWRKQADARFHEAASHLGWVQWCCDAWQQAQELSSRVAAGERRGGAASQLERRRERQRQRRPLQAWKPLALHDGSANVNAAASEEKQHAPWGWLSSTSTAKPAAGQRPWTWRLTGPPTRTHHHCCIDRRSVVKAAAVGEPEGASLESAVASSWWCCPASRGSSPWEATATPRSCSLVPSPWTRPPGVVCRGGGPSTAVCKSAQQQTAAAQVRQTARTVQRCSAGSTARRSLPRVL